MNNIEGITLGDTIFKKLDTNPYLHELYENILYKYSMRLLSNTSEDYKPIDIEMHCVLLTFYLNPMTQ